ncbi:hypothetical protein Acsp05_48350 [Actinokineospora sp. NBRC 105648]|nr:hypothetical protein Acsp05_48350 [Actinokineospora sp. NBRC 105648]
MAAVAAVIDIQLKDTLGTIYQGSYLVGCVAAICLVRRRNLFGPMVQPPLVFAVTAIGSLVLLAPGKSGSGLKQLIFSVAFPLTSNFPTMALATGITVVLGVVRLFIQRDPNPAVRKRPVGEHKPAARRPAADRAGREGTAAAKDRAPAKDRPAGERPPKERVSSDRPAKPRDPARSREGGPADREPRTGDRKPRDPNRKPPVRRPRPDDR